MIAMKNTAILLISCPDRKGLVATIAEFLYRHNANILHADQHQDSELGLFLMRVEWDLHDFDLTVSQFESHFAPIAEKFDMKWDLALSSYRPRSPFLYRATTIASQICCTVTRPESCTATFR